MLTIQRFKKRCKKIWFYNGHKIIDLAIFMALAMGVFLPVRFFYYTYVTHHVGYNLGIMSLIAITMLILVKKRKLGFVGRAFERQMRRIIFGKTFRKLFFASVFVFAVYGGFLAFIQYGEYHLTDEKDELFAMLIYSDDSDHYFSNLMIESNNYPAPEKMIEFAEIWYDEDKFLEWSERVLHPQVFFPVMMHLVNDDFDGWISHFSAVYVIEELEAIGLWVFYRWAYRNKTVAKAWHKIGVFPKSIKKFCKKEKPRFIILFDPLAPFGIKVCRKVDSRLIKYIEVSKQDAY